MTPLVTAVLVLYRQSPQQSDAFTSLRQILSDHPNLAAKLTLLVYDNSPQPQELPALPVTTRYLSNPANPGLAAAYNTALEQATVAGIPWLLLLDQDTHLTAGYLQEAMEAAQSAAPEIVALLPQLVENDRVHSPQLLPRLSSRPLPPEFHGIAPQPITAFNSGAFLRVAALVGIHGFPTAFPLDFLDHAVFHALSARGGRFQILRARLPHQLSTTTLGGDDSLARYRNILAAEHHFYTQVGGAPARWQRLRRLKQSVGHVLKVSDKRFALWDLRAALGLLR